ncbi:MAG: hypothetical protein ACRDRS_11100 [Pseudonocardiaceae bacterium]
MRSTRIVLCQSVVALALALSVWACLAVIQHASAGLAPILQAIAQIIRAIGANSAEPDHSPTRPTRSQLRRR